MKLADALFGLLLEFFGGWRKIGVLVAEQLVGNFACQNHAQIGVFVNPLAKKIHAHARADGRNIIRAEHPDDLFQTIEHLLLRHIDLGVLASDVVCHLLGIFEVDRVLAHADGKRADGRIRLACGNRADERRIKTAREQEPDLRIGHEALFHAANELVVNLRAHRVQIIVTDRLRLCDVAVADELAVLVVMSGRERHDLIAEGNEVLWLAGEDDHALFVIAVIERPDTDGVARGDILFRASVVKNQRKLRVKHFKHVHAVLKVQRKQNLAVRAADELVFLLELLFELLEPVNLAVADHIASVALKRLHAAGR